MYTTNTTSKNKDVPYWNEIKNLSREDRICLAKLLSESLEAEKQNGDVDSYLSEIDETLMRRTVECVHKQYLAGICISHGDVLERIKDNMGWK